MWTCSSTPAWAGDAWSGGDAWKDLRSRGGSGHAALWRRAARSSAWANLRPPRDTTASSAWPRRWAWTRIPARGCATAAGPAKRFPAPWTVYPDALGDDPRLMLTDGAAQVLCEKGGAPQMTLHALGKGLGVYLSNFRVNPRSTRMLLELLLLRRPCGPAAVPFRYPLGGNRLLPGGPDAGGGEPGR